MKSRLKWLLWIFPAIVILSVLFCIFCFSRQIRQERLDQSLIQAIKKQDVQTAISLLNQGANANATNRPYRSLTWKLLLTDLWDRLRGSKPPQTTQTYSPALTLVYGPVGFGLPDTSIGMLLNSEDFIPVDVSVKYKKDAMPLISALLDHGASLETNGAGLDARVRVGEILLKYACIREDAQTVQFLLERHFNPNATVLFGLPLLMCTTDYECARLLLEAGADANARDPDGRTCLMALPNAKQYSLLLAHGADPNLQDKEGRTALMHLLTSVYQRDEDIHNGMHFLLQHGARVSPKDKTGKTALNYAREGRANWRAGNAIQGGYDKESIHSLEEALKRENALYRMKQ
ncbi:MAG: ankyrin repeat protein [Chthonomonadales bacterium]|nr:ankyrin repeat protein [Chthonomonadales bacterium]